MTTHTVTIANRDHATYRVEARRPLLDTLREQGVDLPSAGRSRSTTARSPRAT